MFKKLVYFSSIISLALLLQSCCDYGYVTFMRITLVGVPKQDSISIWGIKNNKALKKVWAKNIQTYSNSNIPNTTYLFNESLDMSVNTSTLAIQYYTENQVIQTDTITVSYKRNVAYEYGCGAYVSIENLKIENSTAKLPTQIYLNK